MTKLFIKFGQKNHLLEMQKEGLLYCNTITFFTNIEGDNNRHDRDESVFETEYFENTLLQFRLSNDLIGDECEWKDLNAKTIRVKKWFEKPLGNLFCMSAFNISPELRSTEFKFHENFLSFGQFGLVIMNQEIFLNRLIGKLKEMGNEDIKTGYGFVNYIDLKNYSGKKNLFQKDKKFAWQEEFRIFFNTNKCENNDSLKISIGNMEDISEIIDLAKTKSLFYKSSD
ncbi:MAG: hypothetical protein ACM3H8_10255 [Sphingobacteriales bacterium]